jgi:hypothetical protein
MPDNATDHKMGKYRLSKTAGEDLMGSGLCRHMSIQAVSAFVRCFFHCFIHYVSAVVMLKASVIFMLLLPVFPGTLSNVVIIDSRAFILKTITH